MAKQWTKADILNPSFSYSQVAPGDTLAYEGIVYTFDGKKFVPPNQQQAPVVGSSVSLNVANPLQNGNTDMAAFQEAAADASKEQQARAQTDAQRGYQLGNRDPRVEADKDAAMRAAATFNQKMGQQSAASGAGAAVLASMNTVDPTATLAENRARADAQALVGSQHQLTAETARQQELAKRASASEFNRVEQDRNTQNAQATELSLGGGTPPVQQPGASVQQSTPTPTPAPTQTPPKTDQSPAPPQDKPTEAAMNARVEKAIADVKDQTKLQALRQQGIIALKAYYATPSNKTPWKQFMQAVTTAKGAPVNENPALSTVEGVTTQYNPDGTPVAPATQPVGQKPNPNILSGIRTAF